MDISSALFRNNKSGVKSENLVLFSQTLWELYDLSEKDLVAYLENNSDQKKESCVACLSLSRLFWAYFRLGNDSDRIEALPSLISYCVGNEASEREISEVTDLLIIMNEKWSTLSDEKITEAENVSGYRTLSYYEWLDQAIEVTAAEDKEFLEMDQSYGPENLSMPEAMAVFSSKLLDSIEDPEDLDTATIRASAYWDLCHSIDHPLLYEENLRRIVLELGDSETERKQIKVQAGDMVSHFLTLFPEKCLRPQMANGQ